MATSNVVIAGATYPDVPAVMLNKSGGGTATYTDVSDSTAVATDVAQGKYFYTAQGVRTEGTASGGGSTPPTTPTDAVIFYATKPFTLGTGNSAKNWNGTLYYSTNHSTWSEWNGTPIEASQSGDYYVLYLRGSRNTYLNGASGASSSAWWCGGATVMCCGNLNKLLSYTGTVTFADYAFAYLFFNAYNVDFDITLPQTLLTPHCYQGMFYNTSITKAPSLPATTMKTYCYANMFYGCNGLKNAPSLPATTLDTYCYNSMFYYCKGLVTAPSLPATVTKASCYYGMFSGCKSLTTAPSLSSVTTLTESCFYSMFQNCTSLTSAPALPVTTLAASCYGSMFYGCTSLSSIPALPATTLANYCYQTMFRNCTNIKLSTTQTGAYQTAYRIPTSGTGTTATNALNNMFTGTGGNFAGTPTINTTYYTSNTVIS